MVTLMVVVWGLIGFLILGPRGLSLGLPERPRQAWLAGLVSGLGLTALVLAVLAALGALVLDPHPDWPVMFANFVSNFYEEFIFRGAILGLLLKVLGPQRAWPAALISAVLFCQGHLHYPPALSATVFVAGLVWAWLTIRYKSLWPAWLSHTVADTIVDALFKTRLGPTAESTRAFLFRAGSCHVTRPASPAAAVGTDGSRHDTPSVSAPAPG
jgi:membrane protease YdiL (CAAX protease family)